MSKSKHTDRQRLLLIALLLSTALALWLLLAPDGGMRYLRLRKQLTSVRVESRELEKSNAEVATTIKKLENDLSYLEEIARRDFGMVRKNEIIYDFSPEKKKDSDPGQAR